VDHRVDVVPVGPRGFAQVELHAQPRMQPGEARQHRRDVLPAVAEGRGDAQRAGEPPVVTLH